MTNEFIDDKNENSMKNPFYLEELQNTTKNNNEEITIQNNTTQYKRNLSN